MNIVTNNHARMLYAWAELPEQARKEFDYVNDEFEQISPRFFKYKGAWYDAFEFEYISDQPCYASLRGKWDGIQTDSFFSGIVIRFVSYDDLVIVGRCYV